MDTKTKSAWRRAAFALRSRAEPVTTEQRRSIMRTQFGMFFARALRRLEMGGDGYFARVGASADLAHYAFGRIGSGPEYWGQQSSRLDFKCVRLAWAAVTENLDAIPAHEREFVAKALATENFRVSEALMVAQAVPPSSTPPRGISWPVEFAYLWRRPGQAGSPAVFAQSLAVAPIVTVSDSEARRVGMLFGPDGAVLELRSWGGAIWRPVLEPGGWAPMSWNAFADAACRPPAWVDNPFVGAPQGAVASAPCELSDPYDPVQPRELVAAASAAGAAIARAGALLRVGEMAFRRTTAPKIVLRIVDAGPRAPVDAPGADRGQRLKLALGWNCGNLDSGDVQHTIDVLRGHIAVRTVAEFSLAEEPLARRAFEIATRGAAPIVAQFDEGERIDVAARIGETLLTIGAESPSASAVEKLLDAVECKNAGAIDAATKALAVSIRMATDGSEQSWALTAVSAIAMAAAEAAVMDIGDEMDGDSIASAFLP